MRPDVRPFRVFYRRGEGWVLHQRVGTPGWYQIGFATAHDAICYAQRLWPWWP